MPGIAHKLNVSIKLPFFISNTFNKILKTNNA